MIVQIEVTLKASRLDMRAVVDIPYASVTVLNTDSEDRAIATFMDANPMVADVIEHGMASITTREIHWSKQPESPPSRFEAAAQYLLNN